MECHAQYINGRDDGVHECVSVGLSLEGLSDCPNNDGEGAPACLQWRQLTLSIGDNDGGECLSITTGGSQVARQCLLEVVN